MSADEAPAVNTPPAKRESSFGIVATWCVLVFSLGINAYAMTRPAPVAAKTEPAQVAAVTSSGPASISPIWSGSEIETIAARGIQSRIARIGTDIANITTDVALQKRIGRMLTDVLTISHDEQRLADAAARAHGTDPRVSVVWVSQIEGWAELHER